MEINNKSTNKDKIIVPTIPNVIQNNNKNTSKDNSSLSNETEIATFQNRKKRKVIRRNPVIPNNNNKNNEEKKKNNEEKNKNNNKNNEEKNNNNKNNNKNTDKEKDNTIYTYDKIEIDANENPKNIPTVVDKTFIINNIGLFKEQNELLFNKVLEQPDNWSYKDIYKKLFDIINNKIKTMQNDKNFKNINLDDLLLRYMDRHRIYRSPGSYSKQDISRIQEDRYPGYVNQKDYKDGGNGVENVNYKITLLLIFLFLLKIIDDDCSSDILKQQCKLLKPVQQQIAGNHNTVTMIGNLLVHNIHNILIDQADLIDKLTVVVKCFRNRVTLISGTCWLSSFYNILYLNQDIKKIITTSPVFINFLKNRDNRITNFKTFNTYYLKTKIQEIIKEIKKTNNRSSLISKPYNTNEEIYNFFLNKDPHDILKKQKTHDTTFRDILCYLFYLYENVKTRLEKTDGDFFIMLSSFVKYYNYDEYKIEDDYTESEVLGEGGDVMSCLYILNLFDSDKNELKSMDLTKPSKYDIESKKGRIYSGILSSDLDKENFIEKLNIIKNYQSKLLILVNNMDDDLTPKFYEKKIKEFITKIEGQGYDLIAASLSLPDEIPHAVSGLLCKGQKVIIDTNNYINFYDWTILDNGDVGYFYPSLIYFLKK